jgi:hypothetical protein
MNNPMLRDPHLDDLSVTVGGPILSNATHDRDVGVEMTQMVNEVRSPSFPLTAAQQGIWLHEKLHARTAFCTFADAAIDAGRPVPASHARGVAELVSSDRAFRMPADYRRDRSFWREICSRRGSAS